MDCVIVDSTMRRVSGSIAMVSPELRLRSTGRYCSDLGEVGDDRTHHSPDDCGVGTLEELAHDLLNVRHAPHGREYRTEFSRLYIQPILVGRRIGGRGSVQADAEVARAALLPTGFPVPVEL